MNTDEIRQHEKHCRERAAQMADSAAGEAWLEMAERWAEMARVRDTKIGRYRSLLLRRPEE